MTEDLKVIPNPSRKDLDHFILNLHYAQRKPSISYSFGLYKGDKCLGVCTFGKPASNSLCKGVCGEEYSHKVFELNRLITLDGLQRNTLSWFLSQCLRALKSEDLIIVSYADDGVGHKGYIYQATNFIYTGKTKERTDKYVPEGKHSRHYSDEYDHLRKFRTSKHRYVYFTGRNKMLYETHLKYKISCYPKGDNSDYILGEKVKQRVINKLTGEVTYE